ncbi:MAG: hypothetical protein ACRERC_00290 [Candidatus Binatia bacterium]
MRTWCAAALLVMAAGAARATCVGDCNADGEVGIGELILGVKIALGAAELAACPAFDGNGSSAVDMPELIAAVGDALEGCTVAATTAGIVFGGENNRLNAYQPSDGFPKQTVIENAARDPNGRDINGQICFTRGPAGGRRFIAGEDTNQGTGHEGAGWGLFELSGDMVGGFSAMQIGKLKPTYQTTDDGAENYGCGFLSDGRLLTGDVGNQSTGSGNGQLIVWFPPFEGTEQHYCKLDVTIPTAQQIAIDGQDRIFISSSRGPGGVYRILGDIPTSDTAAGGCGRLDGTGKPLADEGRITRELFIAAAGSESIVTPSGVVIRPNGHFYVASVLNGVIAEYDADGQFVREVLRPPAPGLPASTGHPLGIGLASDGTIYYADIGLSVGPGGVGPGRNLGKVRRIRFVNDVPQLPEIMDEGLNFPDGIGILE